MLNTKYNYIYKTTNLINGKLYVGKHSSNIEPSKDKYKGSGRILKQAFKKYEKKNFSFEILEFCIPCGYHIGQRERYWISILDTKHPNGYNLTEGGDGLFNYEFSEEHKAKIGIASKAAIKPQITCPHCGITGNKHIIVRWHFDNCKENPNYDPSSRKQKERSEEHRLNLSNALKGHEVSQETRDKISKVKTGWVYGEEARKNMGDSHRGIKRQPLTQEQKDKISNSKKGIKLSEEDRLKRKGQQVLGKNSRAKKTINIKTGEVFDCIVEAFNSQFVCKSIHSFRGNLNGGRKNKTDFMFLEDYNKLLEIKNN
jgi:group I intron endonuclease